MNMRFPSIYWCTSICLGRTPAVVVAFGPATIPAIADKGLIVDREPLNLWLVDAVVKRAVVVEQWDSLFTLAHTDLSLDLEHLTRGCLRTLGAVNCCWLNTTKKTPYHFLRERKKP